MPRGLHYTAMRSGNLASARGKTVAGIPAFMLKTYEKNKQPGLKSGLTGELPHLFITCEILFVSPLIRPDKHCNIYLCVLAHVSCHCICFSWTAALLRAAFADGSRRQTDQSPPCESQPRLPANLGKSNSRSTSEQISTPPHPFSLLLVGFKS